MSVSNDPNQTSIGAEALGSTSQFAVDGASKDFVDDRRGNMELQMRALGVGAAWGTFTFTLDQKVIETVYDTFQQMWRDDLIYRGERMVNFCTKHQTNFDKLYGLLN